VGKGVIAVEKAGEIKKELGEVGGLYVKVEYLGLADFGRI